MSKYDKEREALGLKPVSASLNPVIDNTSKYAAERAALANTTHNSQYNEAPELDFTPFNNPVTNVFKPYMVEQKTLQRPPNISTLPRPTTDIEAENLKKNVDFMDKNYPNSMKGFTKPVSLDSLEKDKPGLLDIPVMAVKGALEIPNDLKNLSIYGTRVLGEALTGQPIESFRPEGYSIVDDILPESWGKGLNEFEKNNPFLGGLLKSGVENGLDVTNIPGGGLIGELSKAGVIGKNAIEGSVENLKTMGDLSKKSFDKVDKITKLPSEELNAAVKAEPEIKEAQPDIIKKPLQSSDNMQVKYTTYREPEVIKPTAEPLTQVSYTTAREPVTIKPTGESEAVFKTSPLGDQVSVVTPKGESVYASRQVGEPVQQVHVITPKGESIPVSKQFGDAQVSIVKPMMGSKAKQEQAIDELLSDSGNWKDKATALYNRETLERNIEDIAGADAPKVKEYIVAPVKKNEADRIRFLNKERDEIGNLSIKPRSKESEFLQKYGEGFYIKDDGITKVPYTLSDLQRDLPDSWEKVVKAEQVIRKKYDRYLDEINTVLIKNGFEPIPERQDYFMHFNEVSDKIDMFGIPNNKLPTDINGVTDDFLPGKNFFSSALERKGPRTSYDAVQGIDRYLEGASKLIYHTDDIQRLRSFEDGIRKKYTGNDHLSNFVSNLREYTNNLAGKKSRSDRGMEADFGRGVYRAADVLKRQVGANAVGANISSALTQFIPITQSLATTNKASFVEGMFDTIANIFKNDGFIDKSDFLTRRVGSDRLAVKLWTDRTDLNTVQKAIGNTGALYNKVGETGGWLFKVFDDFVSQVIVRSKYLEGLKNGMPEAAAMKNADEWASRIMADRSLGSMPNFFNKKGLMGALTQFQLEVNNQLSFMFKDIPKNSLNWKAAASSIGQVFLYGYLFNELYEKAVGRRPAFDPIGIIGQAYEDYTNQGLPQGAATKNLAQNIANQLPFTSLITSQGGRIPLTNSVPDIYGVLNNTTTLDKELGKIPGLISPTGANQIKKTLNGLNDVEKGGVYKDNKLQYPIEDTPQNFIRGALFGPSSFPETQKFYNNNEHALSEGQTTVIQNAGGELNSLYQGVLLNRELDAAKSKRQDIKPIKEKIITYFNQTNDPTVFYSSTPSRTITIRDQKYDLDDAQYTELVKNAYQYATEGVERMKQSKVFMLSSPERQYDYMHNAINLGVTKAENEMKRQLLKNGY